MKLRLLIRIQRIQRKVIIPSLINKELSHLITAQTKGVTYAVAPIKKEQAWVRRRKESRSRQKL